MSLEVKIENFLLAPSKLSDLQLLYVTSFIFGHNFLGFNEFRIHFSVETASYENLQLKKSHDVTNTMKHLLQHFKNTVQIGVEECAGYTVLGNLLVFFAEGLSNELATLYRYHNQRGVAVNSNPGQHPSRAAALVSLMMLPPLPLPGSSPWLTKVICEYKPAINQELHLVQPKFLLELFLQCYYTMKYGKQRTLLACLTDLNTWHYFKLKLSNGKLEGLSYSTLYMHLRPLSEMTAATPMEPSETQKKALSAHLLFLVHALS